MTQILVNSLISASLYTIVGLGFALLYQTERFFNLALGATVTLGAYSMLVVVEATHAALFWAACCGVLAATALGIVLSLVVTRRMLRSGLPAWAMLVVSLGLYVIVEGVVSLAFGNTTRTVHTGSVEISHVIAGARITNNQLILVAVGAATVLTLSWFLRSTNLGSAIRAVSSNAELCTILGIDVDRTMLGASAIGSALAGLGGVLMALDSDMTPSMGFPLLLNGVIAFVVGGLGNYRGLILGALLLSLSEHMAAYLLDSKWMNATAFVILIAFLMWKPLGFSGRRLRKAEI